MSKPITGKTTTSVWKQKRKNGDIYVWERQTVLRFCVGSASKAVLQKICSLAWMRARLKR